MDFCGPFAGHPAQLAALAAPPPAAASAQRRWTRVCPLAISYDEGKSWKKSWTVLDSPAAVPFFGQQRSTMRRDDVRTAATNSQMAGCGVRRCVRRAGVVASNRGGAQKRNGSFMLILILI
jgi:hypothetical protein